MSLENTHKLMGFYMEGLILGVSTMYLLFWFFRLFPIVRIGLMHSSGRDIIVCTLTWRQLSRIRPYIPRRGLVQQLIACGSASIDR